MQSYICRYYNNKCLKIFNYLLCEVIRCAIHLFILDKWLRNILHFWINYFIYLIIEYTNCIKKILHFVTYIFFNIKKYISSKIHILVYWNAHTNKLFILLYLTLYFVKYLAIKIFYIVAKGCKNICIIIVVCIYLTVRIFLYKTYYNNFYTNIKSKKTICKSVELKHDVNINKNYFEKLS